jgi:predicted peptidase
MRKLALLLGVGVVFAVAASNTHAQDVKHGFVSRVHKGADGDSKYYLFVPHSYTGEKEYPLILFLHGAGERGDDGETPVKQGIGNAIKFKDGEKKFPFFVIFPQCSKKGFWKAGGPDADRAMAMLDTVMKEYKIDSKRLYLTGLSMGGAGTWSLAAAHPDKWAAIAPICFGGDPSTAEKIKHIPCWCFCGDKDNPKLLEGCRTMVKALQAVGGAPRYSEYPYVGHNSWDSAYVTPELYPWLLSHKLK